MQDGFVRVAVGTPAIVVADCEHNGKKIVELMREACAMKAKVLTLPELCVTGYTAGDLFFQRALQSAALEALVALVAASRGMDMLTVVGLPLVVEGRMYNCAAVIQDGRVLGVVPKRNLPNYGEFYELRHFTPGEAAVREISLLGEATPFGGDILFCCEQMPEFQLAVELCEDLWVPQPPSIDHALSGATVIANPSASDEVVGKAAYREMLLKSQSARLLCGYLYADAGAGESSTDLVFSGHNLIAENGAILSASERYECGLITSDLDIQFLVSERTRMNTFGTPSRVHAVVPFQVKMESLEINRYVDPAPFVPFDERVRARRCEEILLIQASGLATRLKHIGCKTAIVGVSGGLDSTLALVVAARAFEQLNLDKRGLVAITMPCFGTTKRTHDNARLLAEGFHAKLIEVDITKAVTQHFLDIDQAIDNHDVTFENAQARERTQVLMDYANKVGGIVVGTGDLSELALGWATYNGDHMSMYGVNAGVPKTLVKHLVAYAADRAPEGALKRALEDVLETPVSPELLPPKDGVISQVTEELVGPYCLHDFFLYHMLRRMEAPGKIKRLAYIAFEDAYDAPTIDKWLDVFLKRFFSQQFKRSCLPDGPKVGSVTLSPRGDWRMPSDASSQIWRKML
ncbi:MAG: NAD(+) synthase [Clostridia bacterium]